MMNFKFYKFCQSGFITILYSIFAVTVFFNNISNIPLWGCLIIGIVMTLLSFFPFISIFYPITITAYIVAALISSFSSFGWQLYTLIGILILHLIRFICMLTFARKDPETSLMYDTAIRNGHKL